MLCIFSLTALTSSAYAKPTMTVINNGINGSSNREWLVRVAADPSLFSGGFGSVAVELAFEVDHGELLSVTKNASAWPYDLPSDHNPFDVTNGDGIQLDLADDTVFVPLGSDPFFNGNLVTVFTIETQGSGPTSLHWGGQLVDTGATSLRGSVIYQAGLKFGGYTGSRVVGAIPGDANFDARVDAHDLTRMAQSWQQYGGWTNGDFDLNGFIDVRDLMVMANNWFVGVLGAPFEEAVQSAGLPAPSVPEPAALGVIAGIAPLLARRRRA